MNKRMLMCCMAGGLVAVLTAGPGRAEVSEGLPEIGQPQVLSMEEFVRSATQNDSVFEEILIEQLKLNYRKDLNLPARDIVLSVKGQYDLFLSQDRDAPEASVGLSKLFPFIGTEISATYQNVPSIASDAIRSEFNLLISQPVAQNAFGHAVQLQDKLVGVENEVLRYQIVEAYEDYLALLIDTYYNWYSAYENLQIGLSSYEQNRQLLENMDRRARSKIALPVDVNKVRLLVITKEENVITLKEAYQNYHNLIRKAVRAEEKTDFVPVDPAGFHDLKIVFDRDYRNFVENSRTYRMLDLLEQTGSLQVARNADDLLPSTNILLGYEVSGSDWPVKDEDNLIYAGLSLEWPFPDQVDRARYETSRIALEETRLQNQNKYLELYTDLKNLYLRVEREQEILRLADEKIRLSASVLDDESRNYSFGKISLNDYIDAVNKMDLNRFSKIVHTVQLKKLLLEWLRLTDQLVDEGILKHPDKPAE